MVKLAASQEARDSSVSEDWFDWRVFIDEDDETLREIDRVEYQLPNSYRDPRREATDPAEKFATTLSGWGPFTILAKITFKDKREETIPFVFGEGSSSAARQAPAAQQSHAG